MSDVIGTIPSDVPEVDGANAFLASFTDEEPKKSSIQETDNGTDAEPEETEHSEEPSEAPEEQSEEAPEEETESDPDDQEFEIKVGEELKKAKLKDLKRLYGQDAAITQKSQKLAESQRQADSRFQMANLSLNKQLERAQAHFDQYAGIDFLQLTAQLATGAIDQATFDGIRGDYQAAEANVKFLKEDLGSLVKAQQETDRASFQAASQEALKVLLDEKTGIKGFGKEMYEEIGKFAESQGINRQAFNRVTDPAQIKIVWQALQWQKAEAARKSAEKKVKLAPNKPKTVLRPGSSSAVPQGKSQEAMKAMKRAGGDLDSATNAFAASF